MKKRFFKIIKWIGKYISFSTKFISPEVNQKLSNAIDDKIAQRRVLQNVAIDLHTKVLNEYLLTFLTKQYADSSERRIAFDFANKKWEKYCRSVNATNKLINLKKDSFKKRVKEIVEFTNKQKINTDGKSI